MKVVNKWFVLSLACCFIVLFGMSHINVVMAADSNLKIGFINIAKVMKDSKAAKNARATYQKDLESKKAILKEKGDKVVALEKDFKNTKQDSPAWKGKQEKLAQEVKEFKRLQSDLNEQLKKEDFELTQKILSDLDGILKQISKSENFSIIFERKAAILVTNEIDITDKVIRLYDAQKK